MDYFDDLNPYLVKEDDNENLTRQQTVPPTQPVEQTYVENILRVNVGKNLLWAEFDEPLDYQYKVK